MWIGYVLLVQVVSRVIPTFKHGFCDCFLKCYLFVPATVMRSFILNSSGVCQKPVYMSVIASCLFIWCGQPVLFFVPFFVMCKYICGGLLN